MDNTSALLRDITASLEDQSVSPPSAEKALIVEFLVRILLDLYAHNKHTADAREWVIDHERTEEEAFSLRWVAHHLDVEWETLQEFFLDFADGNIGLSKHLAFTGLKR